MNAMLETQILPGGISISVARGRPSPELTSCAPFGSDQGSRTNETQADLWLEHWGRWALNSSNLGFPERSVTERANEGGIAPGSPRPPTTMPDDIALTDKAVAQIKMKYKSIAWRVIEIVYLKKGPIEVLMQSFRVSRAEAYRMKARTLRVVFRARQSLA